MTTLSIGIFYHPPPSLILIDRSTHINQAHLRSPATCLIKRGVVLDQEAGQDRKGYRINLVPLLTIVMLPVTKRKRSLMQFRNRILDQARDVHQDQSKLILPIHPTFLTLHHPMTNYLLTSLPSNALAPHTRGPSVMNRQEPSVSRICKRKNTVIIERPMANKAIQWNCRGLKL